MSPSERADALARDGHVVVPGLVDAATVEALRAAIEACRRDPSEHHAVLSPAGQAVVDSDLFRWRDVAEIGHLATDPRLVAVACELLEEDPVVFVEDQWFAADDGAHTSSPWHQDGPYYEIDRPFVTCWLTLDDVDADCSVSLVPRSHRSGERWAPVAFDPDGQTISSDDNLPVDTSEPDGVIGFELRAGDSVWFDSRTVHGNRGGSGGRRRRFSLRYAPGGSVRRHPGGTVAAFWEVLDHGVAEGEHLATSPWFPLVSAS